MWSFVSEATKKKVLPTLNVIKKSRKCTDNTIIV
jgi:hypothetical protein